MCLFYLSFDLSSIYTRLQVLPEKQDKSPLNNSNSWLWLTAAETAAPTEMFIIAVISVYKFLFNYFYTNESKDTTDSCDCYRVLSTTENKVKLI